MSDANLGTMPAEIIPAMADAATRSAHIRETVKHHLAGKGFRPDPDLLDLVDMTPVKIDEHGRAIVPAGFAEGVRKAKPHLFVEGHFDARTAPKAEVDARLRDMQSESIRRRNAGFAERDLASLRTQYGPAA